MLVIESARATNFLCFESVDITLPESGVIKVTGENHVEVGSESNESGKTGFVEILVWCLFGKTIKGVRADHVIMWGKDSCFTEVIVRDGSTRYTLSRSKSLGKEAVFKNPGDLCYVPFELFSMCNIFYDKGIDFISARPAQRQEALENFIAKERIHAGWESAKKWVKTIESKQSSLDGKKDILIALLKEYIESVDTIEKDLNKEDNSEAVRKELEVCEKEETGISRKIKIIEHDGEEVKKQVKSLKNEKEKSDKETLLLLGEIDKEINKSKSDISYDEKDIRREEKKLTATKNFESGEVCPTCFQEITEEHIGRCTEEIQEKIDICKQSLKTNRDTLATTEKDWKTLEKDRENLYAWIQIDIDDKEALLEKYDNEHKKLLRDLVVVSNKRGDLSSELSRISSYKETLQEELMAKLEKAETTGTEIDVLENKIVSLNKEKLPFAFWKKHFGTGGFRAWRLTKIIKLINSNLVSVESSFPGFSVSLAPVVKDDGTISRIDIKIIKSLQGEEKIYYYESLSGGARRRVTIMILYALWSISSGMHNGFNLMVCDEIFDTLDIPGRQAIADLFEVVAEKGQVIPISHLPDDIVEADLCLNVVREMPGVSRIEVVR